MTGSTTNDDFFWANGKRVELSRDNTMFAVRFRPGPRSRDSGLSTWARGFLGRSARGVGQIRGHGIHIYDAQDGALAQEVEVAGVSHSASGERVESRSALVALSREGGIDFAAPVLRSSATSTDPIVPTRQFVVSFLDHVTRDQIDELNAKHAVTVVQEVAYLKNGFVLLAPDGDGAGGSVRLAQMYYESPLTEFATPDLVRRRHSRSNANATHDATSSSRTDGQTTRPAAARSGGDLLPRQWHLHQIGVPGAWNITRGKAEIVIAVLDDAFDLDHPEFAGKTVTFQKDYQDNDADVRPDFSSEKHGTACAGVAVAKGERAFGAAPACSLMALRTPFSLGVVEEAQMFSDAADHGADVISCSWGPADGTGTTDPLPDPTRAAIHYCVTKGRDGKGIPIFWAAGNGSESVSADGYASHHEVMAVAASTSEDGHAWYSDTGPEVSIAAPSNGGSKGILTTDRRGSAGYNPGSTTLGDASGDYTNDFGGTSSATPLVAGVAGLVLSAAPHLQWHQVKKVLEDTADKIGGANGYIDGHSNRFGKGRVNARRAVETADAMAGGGSSTPSMPGSARPAIQGPTITDRNGPPPVFDVDTAGRAFMSVEVATEARLFDFDNHGPDRSSSNFFPNWGLGEDNTVASEATYSLPNEPWARLRDASALFVRVHVASDPATWDGYDVSTEDGDFASAHRMEIATLSSTGTNAPAVGGTIGFGPAAAEPAGSGETNPSNSETVRYPSTVFDVAASPIGSTGYSDPVGSGVVPLIEVRGRLDEQLSPNFKVREFAARMVDGRTKVPYARISPDLVERLQELRDHVGAGIKISSGYRFPALNADVGGAERSQHMTGRAVDMKVTGLTSLELVERVLDVFGFGIGVGLGASTVHVDVRGHLATWTYRGAELDEDEFDRWVRDRRDARTTTPEVRSGSATEDGLVAVDAPSRWRQGSGSPAFRVRSGNQQFWGLEVATSEAILHDPKLQGGGGYWRSWHGALASAGESEWITATLDESSWKQLSTAESLRYRAFTSDDSLEASNIEFSEIGQIAILRGVVRDARIASLSEEQARRVDERLWREAP